jgi:hypothetical protein
MVRGEAGVVEDAGGHGQGQALGEGENLLLRSRRADVRAAHEQGILGIEQGIPDRVDDARLRDQAHVGRIGGLDDRLHVGRLQRRAGVGHVNGTGGERGGVLECPPGDGRDASGLPDFPAPLRDVLDGAHLGESPARHEGAVVAV